MKFKFSPKGKPYWLHRRILFSLHGPKMDNLTFSSGVISIDFLSNHRWIKNSLEKESEEEINREKRLIRTEIDQNTFRDLVEKDLPPHFSTVAYFGNPFDIPNSVQKGLTSSEKSFLEEIRIFIYDCPPILTLEDAKKLAIGRLRRELLWK